MKKKIILILLILSAICFAEVLTNQEEQLIYDILEGIDLDSTSVNFLKDWASDTKFKIPLITNIINNPMKFPEFVAELESEIEEENLLNFFGKTIFNQKNRIVNDEFKRYFEHKVKTPDDIFDYTEYIWKQAEILHNKTWEKLTEEEISQLEYFAITVHQEMQDSLKYNKYISDNNITDFSEMDIEGIIPILEKIDFGSIIICAQTMQAGFDILNKNHDKIQQIISESEYSDERLLRETSFGKFVIGTVGTDLYNEDYSFILDVGGDDIYSGNISANSENPFYWILDIGGDDKYSCSELKGLFSVDFGCGISADLYGNDFYSGDDYSFSWHKNNVCYYHLIFSFFSG